MRSLVMRGRWAVPRTHHAQIFFMPTPEPCLPVFFFRMHPHMRHQPRNFWGAGVSGRGEGRGGRGGGG